MDNFKIDLEELRKYEVSEEAIETFLRMKIPEGLFLLEYYEKNIYIIPELLGEIHYRVPLSPEEKTLVETMLKIKDSRNFFMCHDLSQCNKVSSSYQCSTSSNIYNSNHVKESERVYKSSGIKESKDIRTSFDVNRSSHIDNSSYVESSHYIKDSTEVNYSSGIKKCNIVHSSNYCFDSDNIEECGLLYNCKNVNNAIACSGITDQEDRIFCTDELNGVLGCYIFNKKVTSSLFIEARNALQKYILEDTLRLDDVINSNLDKPSLPTYNKLFDSYAFWHWLKTNFIFYVPEIAYQITLNDKCMKI